MAISACCYQGLALKSDSTVVGWGSYPGGSSYIPTQVPPGLTNVVAISAGFAHCLALKSDGSVVAWGDNSAGQSTEPATLRGALAIAAGGHHSLALEGYPPSVRTTPLNQTAETGSTVEIGLTADGTLPLTYQWFFNNSLPITEATDEARLQLTDIDPAQAGTYTVVVSNLAGAVTSTSVTLSVIPPVERRWVPGLTLNGQPGSALNLDIAHALDPATNWAAFDSVVLTNDSQWYFDLSAPLPMQRFYRAWQPGEPGVLPALDLHMIPVLTLTGAVGSTVRVDGISQFGPTEAWFPLAMVTLTNSSQLYFDTSTIGQPPRLWRIVPVP
jgi:hypothetical protein